MKPTNQTLEALRLALDLEAIATREGLPLAEVLEAAGDKPDRFVMEWITENYFNVIGGF